MNKKLLIGLLCLVLSGLLLFGCGKVVKVKEAIGTGNITGVMYAADGITRIGGVKVSIPGSAIDTLSAADGSWTLKDVPLSSATETKDVNAEVGSWKITFKVNCEIGKTVSVPAANTTFSQSNLVSPVQLAVISGNYDSIEDVIDKLGYSSLRTTIQFSDLNDYSYISNFEAIFINCGIMPSPEAAAIANLKKFVEVAGKSLYVSDWAANFLEETWPSYIDFYGSDGVAASTPEDIELAKVGREEITVEAVVEDSILKMYVLSKEVASIFYDLDYWVVISAEGTGTNVLLRGTPEVHVTSTTYDFFPHSPLAVRFQPAGPTKGTVLYTTFHNEPQEELVSEDAKKILNYFIMHL